MLNALRHQRLGQTESKLRAFSSEPCAQRLTASKVGTDSGADAGGAGGGGAQRLTASKVGTAFWQRGRLSFNQVLNALRHQRLGQCQYSTRCTPHGSAQRLTASKVGTGSPRSNRKRDIKRVLNALRHQRLGQSSQYTPRRLSEKSAQRLTASKVGTGISFVASMLARTVLNALRHQRLGQLTAFLVQQPTRKCSTPYGIKGWDRMRCDCESSNKQVLNALRHQRLGQTFSPFY